MLPILQILGLALQLPPMTVLIGLVVSTSLAGRLAERRGLNGNVIGNAGMLAFVAGVIGARLGYVLLNWSAYQQDLSAALALNANGLLAASGWLCALVAGGVYLQRKGALTLAMLDAIAPAAIFFLACWALSALFSGDGFGTPTTVAWAIDLWGAQRHPVQAYEALLLLLLALLTWRVSQAPHPSGAMGLAAIIGVALIRVFVDGFRADAALLGGLRVTQLAGVMTAIVAIWLRSKLHSGQSSAGIHNTSV